MKILFSLTLIFFALTVNSFTQELPEYGKLAEIKGKKLVYLATDNPDGRKQILGVLSSRSKLTVVDRTEDAEFFIAYKVAGKFETKSALSLPSDIGQIDVYYLRNEKRVIVFSETNISPLRDQAAENLTKKFLKALVKKT